jgi:hypothetical protein
MVGPLNLAILPVGISRNGVRVGTQEFEQLPENGANKSFSIVTAHYGGAIVTAIDRE